MATVYHSKTDGWIVTVLSLSMVVSLYAIFEVITTDSPAAWWVVAISGGIGIGLPLWILLSTRYRVESRQLVVRSGPFKWKIQVADITSITPTSNALSSPALSLDRLRIDYGHGSSLMISPRNKEQFLRDIEALRRGAL